VVLTRTIVAIALLLLGSLQTVAQDGAPQFRYPRNDEIVRYERHANIPETLVTALRKLSCKLDDEDLKGLPILAFRPMPGMGGYAVLATCRSIVRHSFMFWQRNPRTEPQPMWFVMPNVSGEPGFGVTRSPGFLEWNAETKTLSALQTTDICPRVVGRTTYRLIHGVGRDAAMPSWMLTKMETTHEPHCERSNDWTPYWAAAPWPDLPKPTP
jgi:hypothetical protein